MKPDSNKLYWMPALIAIVILTGFFSGKFYVMYHVFSVVDAAPDAWSMLNMYVVATVAALSGAIGYFIGTTHGSKTKDDMLYNSVPAPTPVEPVKTTTTTTSTNEVS